QRTAYEIQVRLEFRRVLFRSEELFAERTRFFSAASHDLRQPLNAMGLYFELLARSPDQEDRNEIIARLQDCATSLLRQFDAIMEIGRASCREGVAWLGGDEMK